MNSYRQVQACLYELHSRLKLSATRSTSSLLFTNSREKVNY